MKAITVKQPWAWAIAHGEKSVENRSRQHPWTSAIGERIAIHAGKGWDRNAWDLKVMFGLAERVAYRLYGHEQWYPAAGLITVMAQQFHHRGAVLATAQLDDVHQPHQCSDVGENGLCSPWAQADAWHLVLSDIQPLPQAIPCRGYQGLWTVPDGLLSPTEGAA
jgi:hypothetical protein